jgi:hypothetical protein
MTYSQQVKEVKKRKSKARAWILVLCLSRIRAWVQGVADA